MSVTEDVSNPDTSSRFTVVQIGTVQPAYSVSTAVQTASVQPAYSVSSAVQVPEYSQRTACPHQF